MKIYRLILLLFLLSCQKHEDISFEKIKLEGVPISDYFLDFLHKDTDDFYKNVSIYPEDSQKVVYLSEQNMKHRFCEKFHITQTEIDYFIDNVAQITIPEEFFNVQIKKRFRITLREIEKENPILSDDLKKLSNVVSPRQYIELCKNLRIKYTNSPYKTVIYGVIDISEAFYRSYSDKYSEQRLWELHQICVCSSVIGYSSCRNFWQEKPLLGMLFSSLYCMDENILWNTLK